MSDSKSEQKNQKKVSQTNSTQDSGCDVPFSNLTKKFFKTFFTVIIISAVLIAFSVYVYNCNDVFPNTYIGSTNIGGMSEEQVMDYLNEYYSSDKIKGKVVTLSCNTNILDLSIDDLNASFDNNTTSANALKSGRERNILANTVSYISRLFSPSYIKPVLIYDQALLQDSFDSVTSGFEVEPVGHTFSVGDDLVTIYAPMNGIKADRKIATETFEDQLCNASFSSIDLVPVTVFPEKFDLDEFYAWLTADAQNAFYEKVDGKVVVREARDKCEVDRKTVQDAISTLKSTGLDKVTIPAIITKAEKSTKDVAEVLYKNVLGSYSTNYGVSSAARAGNIVLASSRINGTELMPGEEFSYDKAILPRTSENGYMTAGVYIGNKTAVGIGGGVCQPSSTLYVAALYANLEIVERHNHSLSVGYLPPGLDATVAEGFLDLKLHNSTEYPIKILAVAKNGVVKFDILGYNPENITVSIERGFDGVVYSVTRVVKKDGAEIKREKMGSSKYGTPEET